MRQCRYRRGLSAGRHRPGRRVAGLRIECRHHGLRDRSCVRLPPQSGRYGGTGRWRSFSGRTDRAICDCADHRCRRCFRPALYVIATGAAGFDVGKGLASNGYDAHSPGPYSMITCFIMEVVMTMMFLFIIMGATHGKAPAGFAPLAIGLALVMIHLVSIPVTNTSVNPARSTGPALFVGGWALSQLWMFWVAPLIGGALGGVSYRWLSEEPTGTVQGRNP